MRLRICIAVFFVFSFLAPISAQSADTCSTLNIPALADDNLTVTISNMSVVEKVGSYQLTIVYKLQNSTIDKKIDEGTFKIFFTDDTSEPQYGFFGSFFPGDSKERSYTWEYLKSKSPLAISYNAGFFTTQVSASKLNWAPPGQDCNQILSKTAAEKAAADKAAAAIKAAEDEAATKKARADSANSTSKFLVDQVVSTREELKLRIIGLVKIYPAEKIALNALLQSNSILATVTPVNYKEIEKTIYQVMDQVDGIENAAAAKVAASKKTTITCVKGKLTKKVSAVNPKCPTGYKVKK